MYTAVAETIRAVSIGLRDTIRKPTEAALFDNYGRVCMVIDEVINEARTRQDCCMNTTILVYAPKHNFCCFQGILEATERDAIQRGMKMKVSILFLRFTHCVPCMQTQARKHSSTCNV